MKLILKPSLEQMTLVKITISLWSQNDVRDLISKLRTLFIYEYNKIGDKVIEKVSHLKLPQPLKEKLLNFVMPIGLEILKYMQYHSDRYFRVDLPRELCWTPEGTIDRNKTAEVVVKDESLDISTRYKLACIYCIEVEIKKLWWKMPHNLRLCFSQQKKPGPNSWKSVVFFWTCKMASRGLSNAHTYTNKDLFYACNDNKSAAEYFLNKLNLREREECLVLAAKIQPCFDLIEDFLIFILSELNEEQQIIVLQTNPYAVLQCFLTWPLQSLFIKIADHALDALSKMDYHSLLIDIINKINDGYRDWNYKKLYSELSQKCPNAAKGIITYELDRKFSLLMRIKDKNILRLILKDATLAEKKKLIFNFKVQKCCYWLVCDDRWDLLELFIKECLTSDEELMKFKEVFDKRLGKFEKRKLTWNMSSSMELEKQLIEYEESYKRSVEKKQKWDEFFSNSVCRCNKKSAEVSECSSPKRFRSLQ